MQQTTDQSSTAKLNALGIGPDSGFGGIVCTSSNGPIDHIEGEQITIIGFPAGINCQKPDCRFERIISQFKEKASREVQVHIKDEQGRVFVEVVVRVFTLGSMWELRNLLAYLTQQELEVNFTT